MIHQTFAFLFALSSVHRVSVSHFFILYQICFLVTLRVRIDKGPWFSHRQLSNLLCTLTILLKTEHLSGVLLSIDIAE